MAIFTEAELRDQLSAWKQALMAVSSGQTYRIGERWLSRADLPEIRKTLEWLESQRSAALGLAAGPRVMIGRPAR